MPRERAAPCRPWIDVRANDSDPDGEPLTLTSVAAPSHGSAVVTARRQGPLHLRRRLRRARHVQLPRHRPPRRHVDGDCHGHGRQCGPGGDSRHRVDTGGTAVTVPLLPLVSDPDGQPVAIASVGPAGHGIALLDPATGNVRYTPVPGYLGTDSFCYTATDGNGGSATACVTVTVRNTPPVANDDASVTSSGTPVKVDVRTNDSDPNPGQTLDGHQGHGHGRQGDRRRRPGRPGQGHAQGLVHRPDGDRLHGVGRQRWHCGRRPAGPRDDARHAGARGRDPVGTLRRSPSASASVTLDPADTVTGHGVLAVTSRGQARARG